MAESPGRPPTIGCSESWLVEPCLQGTYRLSRGVILDARLTRDPKEFPIRVGTISGSASLPELRPGAFGRPRLVTPPLIRLGRSPGWSDGRGPSTPWGHPLDLDRLDDDGAVSVAMLAMRFPLPAAGPNSVGELVNRLYESMGPWSKRLTDWLDVVFDRPRFVRSKITLSYRKTARLHGLTLERVDAAGSKMTEPPPPQPEPIQFEVLQGVEERDWWSILDRVSAGVDPPIERLLLRDARQELEQDPRRAVLDVGTAAELALTRMLDNQLRGLPSNVADVITRQSRQLGRLSETLSRLDVVLPQSLQNDLIDVRIAAAHRGRPPSIEQAEAALRLAGDLVEQAQPIRDLLTL
jgi:hypothetical protein